MATDISSSFIDISLPTVLAFLCTDSESMNIDLIGVRIDNCFFPFWFQITVMIAVPLAVIAIGAGLAFFLNKRGRVGWSRLSAGIFVGLPLLIIISVIVNAQVEQRKVSTGNVDGLEYIKKQYEGIPQAFDSIGNPNAKNSLFVIYCSPGTTCSGAEITQAMAEYIPRIPGIKEGLSQVTLYYNLSGYNPYNIWAAGKQGKAQEYSYLYYRNELRDSALQKIGIDPEAFRTDLEYIQNSPEQMLENQVLRQWDPGAKIMINVYPKNWVVNSEDPKELASAFEEAIDHYKTIKIDS